MGLTIRARDDTLSRRVSISPQCQVKAPPMKLELRDISLQYPDKPPLFEGVNLTLESGGFLIVGGVSGSGKSSLLRLLNRLQEPTSGEILVDDRPMADQEVTQLRRRIGYVQQTPLVTDGTVEENLRLPYLFRANRALNPPGRDELRERLDAFALTQVSLDDDAGDLSVGQKQRIGLIRSLSVNPEMLLCDEPTSALDPASKDIVEDCLEHVNVDLGIGVVLVSHTKFTPKRVRPTEFVLNGLQGREGGTP